MKRCRAPKVSHNMPLKMPVVSYVLPGSGLIFVMVKPQVSELMPVVILRFFFERFLLTQLAGIGHVMVINLVFSFVGIVSSLTKRSYDEYFVKLKMRHTRAANAVMAAPTFNNVMLSMRFSELMSEHAAIWTTAALYQYLRINLGEPGTPPLMHNIYWSAFIQVKIRHHAIIRLAILAMSMNNPSFVPPWPRAFPPLGSCCLVGLRACLSAPAPCYYNMSEALKRLWPIFVCRVQLQLLRML